MHIFPLVCHQDPLMSFPIQVAVEQSCFARAILELFQGLAGDIRKRRRYEKCFCEIDFCWYDWISAVVGREVPQHDTGIEKCSCKLKFHWGLLGDCTSSSSNPLSMWIFWQLIAVNFWAILIGKCKMCVPKSLRLATQPLTFASRSKTSQKHRPPTPPHQAP